MEKKTFAMYDEYGLNTTLKHLQENGAEIVNIMPAYNGYGYDDNEFHFSTTFCVIYKSESEIPEYKFDWEKENDSDSPF